MTVSVELAALLLVEQRTRWQRGERVPVEDYLERNPSLRADAHAVADLVWGEVALRRQRGESPQVEEYLRRFEEWAPVIRERFGLELAAEDLSRTPATSVAPFRLTVNGGDASPGDAENLPDVPGYEVLAEVGRGGMGVVYKARQTELRRLVALKMILSGPRAGSTARTRFRTEAEAVGRLNHPNIVQIYEVGDYAGQPFLSLEYVGGGSLEDKTKAAPPTETQAAALVETIARAVAHAHRNGILHRDLKPGNVLLTDEGVPKVADFGLAKLLDAAPGPTPTEALIGTPSYMSPEQAAGNPRAIGPAADVYSLGAILYELLTRRPPIQGNSLLDTLERVRTEEPVRPRRLRSGISRDLEVICLKCLEKEPGKRYATARELADDLRCFLDGRPVLARPISPWQRLWRAARRRPRVVARLAGAVVVLCLVVPSMWYVTVADRLARQHADDEYAKFVRHRDEAFFHGLLTPDQGTFFTGSEAAAGLAAAEKSARAALTLAGMRDDSETLDLPSWSNGPRQAEVAADCYSLLLVLAEVRGQQPVPRAAQPERYREALQILARAGQLGLDTRAYHLRRSYFLEQLSEHKVADAEKERADAMPPQTALDFFLLGEGRYRQGNREEAAADFNRVLALQPGHFWARFLLAASHLQLRQWEAARAGLNACIAARPDFVWAYLFRSFANEKLRSLPEAEEDFQHALRLDPDEDARYTLLLMRGILRFNQKELRQAEADFHAAADLKPASYNAYLNLAQVCLAEERFDEAAGYAERSRLSGAPDVAVLGYHIERSRALLKARKYDEAVRACDTALGIAPEHPLPFGLRARALLELHHYEQAQQSFDDYFRLNGEATADAFAGRGLARMRLGRFPEAVDDYTQALQRRPGAELYQHRGWAHFFADAWKLALRDFEQSIRLDPEQGDAYTGRGLALVMVGRYREAVADAEEALRRRPDTPEMMHNVACIFAQAAGRADADAEHYRRLALEAIRKTLAMLRPDERRAFWEEKILPDAALTPIRATDGFKQIAAEYSSHR
jgi:tetratricopeptide (TPR) repeat protein/tRNA A-37 threonylcarbamoyl transferase component Bud32